jgi:hypothetical protein
VDREVVLVVLALCVCGPLAVACGAVRTEHASIASGGALERFWWRRLWFPLLPSLTVLSLLLGWALQEPDASDEGLRVHLFVIALPFALIWARATGRAVWALRRQRSAAPVETIGLWRPQIRISPTFAATVDGPVLAAAHAHELAHGQHRDPLRIWLGQWASDLQWPGPATARRWREWRWALELARDDEARARGVDGADLAAAIVAAAQVCVRPVAPAAGLVGEAAALAARVDRLLRPLPPEISRERTRWPGVALVALVVLTSCTLGVLYGEQVLRAIPGVGG